MFFFLLLYSDDFFVLFVVSIAPPPLFWCTVVKRFSFVLRLLLSQAALYIGMFVLLLFLPPSLPVYVMHTPAREGGCSVAAACLPACTDETYQWLTSAVLRKQPRLLPLGK